MPIFSPWLASTPNVSGRAMNHFRFILKSLTVPCLAVPDIMRSSHFGDLGENLEKTASNAE
jgi:hypothetical protein